jgi:hypothetical protein
VAVGGRGFTAVGTIGMSGRLPTRRWPVASIVQTEKDAFDRWRVPAQCMQIRASGTPFQFVGGIARQHVHGGEASGQRVGNRKRKHQSPGRTLARFESVCLDPPVRGASMLQADEPGNRLSGGSKDRVARPPRRDPVGQRPFGKRLNARVVEHVLLSDVRPIAGVSRQEARPEIAGRKLRLFPGCRPELHRTDFLLEPSPLTTNVLAMLARTLRKHVLESRALRQVENGTWSRRRDHERPTSVLGVDEPQQRVIAVGGGFLAHAIPERGPVNRATRSANRVGFGGASFTLSAVYAPASRPCGQAVFRRRRCSISLATDASALFSIVRARALTVLIVAPSM